MKLFTSWLPQHILSTKVHQPVAGDHPHWQRRSGIPTTLRLGDRVKKSGQPAWMYKPRVVGVKDFLFSPLFGEDEASLTNIFQMG